MNSSENNIKRSDFPKDFIFGAATSAYQVEGAWNAGGKGKSNWDWYTLNTPGGTADCSNGCVAADHYNMFKEDVDLLKKVGVNSYRFSIAWTRILPGGKLSGGICKDGVNFYNGLINALLAEGIEPCATLFHWDVPQCLEDEYGGFLDEKIVKDFCEFAEVCFWEFGDQVKRWITLNEPWSFTYNGYVRGTFPPCRGETSPEVQMYLPRVFHRSAMISPQLFRQSKGDPGKEPYIVAHNLILAHANAVDLYRKNYKKRQGGKIGITNVSVWCYPFRPENKDDKEAVSRAVDFMLGWFVAPVITGDYPPSMRKYVNKERLPNFKENAKLVKGSFDFLGINYYTSYYAKNHPLPKGVPTNYDLDKRVEYHACDVKGNPIGPQAGSDWLYIVPEGIYHLMLHVKDTYNNPDIYITENGVSEKNDKRITISKAREDQTRIDYHKDHLWWLRKAMDDGVRLKGYYMWSLMDNFEWAEGYSVRFGIFHVDFMNGRLTRFPKSSAIWWMNFLGELPEKLWKLQLAEKIEEKPGHVKKLSSGVTTPVFKS